MNKPEIQSEILKYTKLRSSLVSAIDKLPDSETRGEIIYKHSKVLQRLTDLHTELELVGKDACYYGFTDECPGCHCDECKYLLGEANGR